MDYELGFKLCIRCSRYEEEGDFNGHTGYKNCELCNGMGFMEKQQAE